MKYSKSLILAVLISATNLFAAEPPVKVDGKVVLIGNGCSNSNASTTLSPDKTSLSVIFDSYSQKNTGYKYCLIGIPLKIASGKKLQVKASDYRGFTSLPTRSQSILATQAYLFETKGVSYSPVKYLATRGAADNDIYFRANSSLKQKGCGGSVYLWLTSSIFMLSPKSNSSNDITIDSLDFVLDSSSGFISTENCK